MEQNVKNRVAVALWIDDADVIVDRSEEALSYLLDMLDRLGIRATFKLSGEKIRKLAEHNRQDIIKRLRMHEVSFHSESHSKHPIVIEYTESLSFRDGAREFERREICGFKSLQKNLETQIISYGQPGDAWCAEAFPVLLKHGMDVNLDEHFMIDIKKQAFEFGGVINFNRLSRIMRYDYHNEEDLKRATDYYDQAIAEDRGYKYPEKVKLVSVYYHPSEFFTAEYMADYYNYVGGKNNCYDENGNFTGYIVGPLYSESVEHQYIDRVGKYLQHMIDSGARFVTCRDLRNLVVRRDRFIEKSDIENIALSLARGEIGFYDIAGEYVSASECFTLVYQYLTNKVLSPFLVYGPECREISCIKNGAPVTKTQISAAMSEFDFVLGFPQLKSSYRVGEHVLSPLDLLATAAYLIANNVSECIPVKGELISEKYVDLDGDSNWDGRWLYSANFKVPNTYEKTKLQCWTLKPLRF